MRTDQKIVERMVSPEKRITNPRIVFQLKLKMDLVYSSAKVFKIAMFFGLSTNDSARRWCQKNAKS